MIDLHCHILPGLDDGAPNIEASLEMAQGLRSLGYRAICCTPHNPWGTAVYDRQVLADRRQQLAFRLRDRAIDLTLLSGAEHHSSIAPELIQENRLVCYPRAENFLMELPLNGFPSRLNDLLFLAQVKGKRPVLAHVERYREVQSDFKVLTMLRERGCFFWLIYRPWQAAGLGKPRLQRENLSSKAWLTRSAPICICLKIWKSPAEVWLFWKSLSDRNNVSCSRA